MSLVHMGFVVGKVALGEIYLQEFRVSPASVIPLVYHRRYVNSAIDRAFK